MVAVASGGGPSTPNETASPEGRLRAQSRALLLRTTREPFGVLGEGGGQDLDGGIAAEFRVPGAKDLAHPARAYRRDDLVGTDTRTAAAVIAAHLRDSDPNAPIPREQGTLPASKTPGA